MHLFVYKAELVRIVDGDTIDLRVDLGFRTYKRVRVRLQEVDTPEIYGVKKGSEEYKRGIEAKSFVADWFKEYQDSSGCVNFDSQREDTGKYGRWIGDIISREDETSLVESIKKQDFMNE
jgi:micrococcal nuclease